MIYIGMANRVRQLVSSNVFLYKIWFYSIRKHKGNLARLPVSGDDFYFDGYPRSGNTFFAGLLKKVYPQKMFAHHLHTIAPLKIALELKLPIFVIIRKPEDAVISNLYRKVKGNKESFEYALIDYLLVSYINYYSFVKAHINDLHVLNFDVCIRDKLFIVRQVAQIAGLEPKSNEFLQKILTGFQDLMQNREERKKPAASSLPNENRADFKKGYLDEVLTSPFYDIAKKIYEELTSEYNFVLRGQSE